MKRQSGMDREDETVLQRLAAAIADGKPIDWKAEYIAYPEVRILLNHLRLLERIATLHQSVGGAGPSIAHANSNSDPPPEHPRTDRD